MEFSEPYAAYKNLFNFVIKADFFADCMDVSADLGTELPFSGRPYKLELVEPRAGDPRPQRGVLERRCCAARGACRHGAP